MDDVAAGLTAEFANRIDRNTVASVVDTAEHDLRGQVAAGAYPELVHRLARVRLVDLTSHQA